MERSVLIVGGSGYLGQFLVSSFASKGGWEVGYTHHSTSAPKFAHGVKEFWADLASGQGIKDAITALHSLRLVINCAAVSQPAVCERDGAYAEAINVPKTLLTALESAHSDTGANPLLLHISTDQVYDGSKADWSEGDACAPVNAYGKTKLAGEQEILARWPNHVILRSSIIFGPPPPGSPVGRALFLQFVDGALASGKPTTFFNDEWRCPIYVEDILKVCHHFATQAQLQTPPTTSSSEKDSRIYNMGGPERLSRVDMAAAVAKVRGYDPALIIPAPSASIDRGVRSPADISMDSAKLWEVVEMRPLKFEDALRRLYVTADGPVE